MQSKFKDDATAHRLVTALQTAKMAAQELSVNEAQLKTPFEIHKSLNILYKELRAHEIFVRTLLAGGSKKQLRETEVEIIKPQSWRFYTHETLDGKKEAAHSSQPHGRGILR